MIPDRNFLRRCAHKNNLHLPQELEGWLLIHFENEPYEDFNTASALEDMIHMYCVKKCLTFAVLSILCERQAGCGHSGSRDTCMTRLKERFEDLKDLITDLRMDISYLQGMCDDYECALKEHDLL